MTDTHPGVATATPISPNGHRAPSRPGTQATATPLRARRRPAFIALGVALAAAGGVMTATIVARTGDRIAVLAVARNVPVGSTITPDDLTVAHVAPDAALSPVRANVESNIVGQVALVGLPAGALLIPTDVAPTTFPAAGQQLIGVAVKPGQLPARALTAGDKVLVAQTPGGDVAGSGNSSGSGPVPTIPATVLDVSAPESDGTVVVDLVVSSGQGPQLAAIASTGHIALIEQPISGGST